VSPGGAVGAQNKNPVILSASASKLDGPVPSAVRFDFSLDFRS
jgi:hypothetical protein